MLHRSRCEWLLSAHSTMQVIKIFAKILIFCISSTNLCEINVTNALFLPLSYSLRPEQLNNPKQIHLKNKIIFLHLSNLIGTFVMSNQIYSVMKRLLLCLSLLVMYACEGENDLVKPKIKYHSEQSALRALEGSVWVEDLMPNNYAIEYEDHKAGELVQLDGIPTLTGVVEWNNYFKIENGRSIAYMDCSDCATHRFKIAFRFDDEDSRLSIDPKNRMMKGWDATLGGDVWEIVKLTKDQIVLLLDVSLVVGAADGDYTRWYRSFKRVELDEATADRLERAVSVDDYDDVEDYLREKLGL